MTEGAANKLIANLAEGAALLPLPAALIARPRKAVLLLSASTAAGGRRNKNVLLLNSGVLLGRAVSVRHTCKGEGGLKALPFVRWSLTIKTSRQLPLLCCCRRHSLSDALEHMMKEHPGCLYFDAHHACAVMHACPSTLTT